MYSVNVYSELLYCCETWTFFRVQEKKIITYDASVIFLELDAEIDDQQRVLRRTGLNTMHNLSQRRFRHILRTAKEKIPQVGRMQALHKQGCHRSS